MKRKHRKAKLNIERIDTVFPKKFYAVVLPVMARDTPGEYTVLVVYLPTTCNISLVRGMFICAFIGAV
jgi:hypothetical protein